MVFMCCVPTCKKSNKQVEMHRFPYLDEVIYNKWIVNIGREDLRQMDPRRVYRSYRVCDDHFPADVRINPEQKYSQSHLIRGACPTLFMPRALDEEPTISTTAVGREEPVQEEEPANEPMVALADLAGSATKDNRDEETGTACGHGTRPTTSKHVHPAIVRQLRKNKRGRKDVRKRLNLLQAVNLTRAARFYSSKRKDFIPPCINNWTKTIRGVKYLWGHLQTEGFQFLCLRNFNQDPLENFFGSIRSHGHRNINPNASAFQSSFKSLVINNFTSTHSPGSNCEKDASDGALNSLRTFLDVPEVEDVRALPADTDDDGTFSLRSTHDTLKIQLHSYLAGYVAKKLLKAGCGDCKHALLSNDRASQEHGLTEARAYNPRALKYVNCFFRQLFSESCQVLHYFLPKLCNKDQLGARLKSKLQKYVLGHFQRLVCERHNVLHNFVKIFVRFYIFTWTKNVNQILKGKERTDLNDEIKLLAYSKCVKKRGRLVKVQKMKGLV